MRASGRWWVGGLLCLVAGCATAPPAPEQVAHEQKASGALLRTGGFQLAPGVSRDLLRSQGDGLQGFPIR
jgi:hypothetical protein